jgi:hypothetical protein
VFGAAAVDPAGVVRYVTPFMRGGYSRVREEGGAVLYRNERPRPRAWAVHRVVLASTTEDAIRRLARGEVRPEEAVVLEDGTARSPTGTGPSEVAIEHDAPLRVDLVATMQGDGYIVLADTHYPGWRATIDGAATPVYLANGSFRAVFVPGGAHRVTFEYQPRWVVRGAVLTGATLALVVVALALASRRRSG